LAIRSSPAFECFGRCTAQQLSSLFAVDLKHSKAPELRTTGSPRKLLSCAPPEELESCWAAYRRKSSKSVEAGGLCTNRRAWKLVEVCTFVIGFATLTSDLQTRHRNFKPDIGFLQPVRSSSGDASVSITAAKLLRRCFDFYHRCEALPVLLRFLSPVFRCCFDFYHRITGAKLLQRCFDFYHRCEAPPAMLRFLSLLRSSSGAASISITGLPVRSSSSDASISRVCNTDIGFANPTSEFQTRYHRNCKPDIGISNPTSEFQTRHHRNCKPDIGIANPTSEFQTRYRISTTGMVGDTINAHQPG
jgi:hypothetical protein